MTEHMVRSQILLDPRQRRRLEELAQREGRSISAVTRQVIDIGLEQIENEAEIWKNRARVLQGLRVLRDRQPSEYAGDLINLARQEREDEGDSLWNSAA